ncbi:MAG: translation elongation factor Ts [Planctomycetota bacterium]|jgi:elongation factor Ts
MAEISAKTVMELRKLTGLGMMECKKALSENDGDIDKAQDWLRKQGQKAADKKAGREVKAGRIGFYQHHTGTVGVMVEVQCEDDFAARNEVFQEFVKDIATHIAGSPISPLAVNRDDLDEALVAKEREIAEGQLAADPKNEKKPEEIKVKIVEGKVNAFIKDRVLMEQEFVKDPKKSIDDLLKGVIQKVGQNIVIRRFARFEVGGE